MIEEQYESERLANIASNKALLESLGLVGLKSIRPKRIVTPVKVEPSDRTTRLASSSIIRKDYHSYYNRRNLKRKATPESESEPESSRTASTPSTDSGERGGDGGLGHDDSDYFDYEAERQAKIASNQALLKSLGLVVEAGTKEKKMSIKVESPKKVVVIPSDRVTRRTSSRFSSSTRKDYRRFLDMSSSSLSHYKRESLDGFIVASSDEEKENGSDDDDDDEADYKILKKRWKFEPSSVLLRKSKPLGDRLYSPKRFGAIPNVSVGTWWATRQECSTASVHAPFVAGISGNAEVGCYSLALSGGYADDIDLGETFTYTGSGGSVLQGVVNGKRLNLRTAPQTFDQSFESNLNAALLTSSRSRRPIRVIRGYKSNSKWAPLEGYLYCGLYVCKRAWLADGVSGFKVCRYAFERLPNQAPLPTPRAPPPPPKKKEEQLSPLRCSHVNCCVEVVVTVDSKQCKSLM